MIITEAAGETDRWKKLVLVRIRKETVFDYS